MMYPTFPSAILRTSLSIPPLPRPIAPRHESLQTERCGYDKAIGHLIDMVSGYDDPKWRGELGQIVKALMVLRP